MANQTTQQQESIDQAITPPPEDVTLNRVKKASYVGAPASFTLEVVCQQINAAYDYCEYAHIYMVGSVLQRADWRDVDLRMIMSDGDFRREFPDAYDNGAWEFDAKWILLTTSISGYLSKLTGLPVDFQFQPMTFANKHHRGPRNAMGMRMVSRHLSSEE